MPAAPLNSGIFLVLTLALGVPPLPAAIFKATDGVIPPADGWQPAYAAVPRVPPFEPALTGTGEARVLTLEQIRARFSAAGANWPVLQHSRQEFLVADHRWLRRFLRWQEQVKGKFDHRYRREVFDCDDFAMGMLAFVDLAMLRSGTHAHPALVGRLIVEQRRRWANIPARGLHEVVLCATSRGLQVVEPQNGAVVPLEEYPNRAHLRWLILN